MTNMSKQSITNKYGAGSCCVRLEFGSVESLSDLKKDEVKQQHFEKHNLCCIPITMTWDG